MDAVVILMHEERRRHKREYEQRLVDWAAIGIEFRRHGWAPTRVADKLALPRRTVTGWFYDSVEPTYSNGARCLAMLAQLIAESAKGR